ncbi:hypothetical protein [Thermus phage P23-45]|uniref:Uncharacterized protein n=1 Tax=Thermus virus P23-45 TaxID=2914006 RepID=A7XX91_BP234|nr:hypothetical protein P23p62 [Thermus phage P23-45]ABU96895.1 hypothetical protein P23p62 [Thermus phage P23-45]UYB98412.1 hypothetical protein [Thermus phage P23-45]
MGIKQVEIFVNRVATAMERLDTPIVLSSSYRDALVNILADASETFKPNKLADILAQGIEWAIRFITSQGLYIKPFVFRQDDVVVVDSKLTRVVANPSTLSVWFVKWDSQAKDWVEEIATL